MSPSTIALPRSLHSLGPLATDEVFRDTMKGALCIVHALIFVEKGEVFVCLSTRYMQFFFFFNWSHPDVFSLQYSKSKFSQNTSNLFSIKVATCFDSYSHQASY